MRSGDALFGEKEVGVALLTCSVSRRTASGRRTLPEIFSPSVGIFKTRLLLVVVTGDRQTFYAANFIIDSYRFFKQSRQFFVRYPAGVIQLVFFVHRNVLRPIPCEKTLFPYRNAALIACQAVAVYWRRSSLSDFSLSLIRLTTIFTYSQHSLTISSFGLIIDLTSMKKQTAPA